MTVQATVYAGSGFGERTTTSIAVALVAIILGGPPLPVVAEDAVQPTRCIRMLRVTGVAQDDVLFLRAFPYVPDSPEPDNRVIGIPPEARRIEELSGGQGEWRHIRYLGQQGYANSRYLAPDTTNCSDALPTKTDQAGSRTGGS